MGALDRAQELDLRRQEQIANQRASIDRLLARITLLEAKVLEGMENDMGRTKDAFMAGFEAGETEDDAKQSWQDYKEKRDAAEAEAEDGDSDDED